MLLRCVVPVDKELVASLVSEVLSQLGHHNSPHHERVLVIGSRESAQGIDLSQTSAGRCELLYSDECAIHTNTDRYILPRLTLNDMADLALGRAVSPIAIAVRDLLLEGKTVEVAEYTYLSHKGSAKPSLFRLYSDYDKTLQSFGLVALAPVVQQGQLHKRVISEQDIRNCQAQGMLSIQIPKNGVLTALGADYAREHGIEIQRGE